MDKRVKKAPLFLVMLILTVLWTMLIFGFSSTDGERSSSQSQSITQSVVRVVDPDYTMPEKPKPRSKDRVYDTIVRKTAHLGVYAVLGVLMFFTVKTLTAAGKYIFTSKLSVLFCIIIAMSDEYNQTLTSGRAGRWYDVLIDSAGVIVGTILCIKLLKHLQNKKLKE